MICAHTIVQNPHNAIAPTEHLIQHWPQPGLLSRLPGRGDRVERIVFKGADYNLWEPFAGAEFRQALAMLGVEFRIDSWPEDRRQCRWHDYQDTDLVLAVRNLTEMDYYIKPASKLINAWHAGTPALLGPEPAFQALRRSELDYVEIRTPEEAVQAVRRLKEDPKLYRTMVENGRSPGANSRRTRSRLVGTRSWPTRSPPGSTAGGGAPPGLKRYPVPPGTPHLPPYIVGSAESTANSVTTATGPSPVVPRDHVKAGIAQARKEGRPHGRPRTITGHAAEVKNLFEQSVSKREIAKRLGISRTSVRRFLDEQSPSIS